MPVEVVVPNLGLGSPTAFLSEWYCPDGAPVACGELVYRLESDFVAIDIEAEAEGILRHRIAAGGIAPGEVVALILAPGERLPREAAAPALDEPPEDEPAWEAAEEEMYSPPSPLEVDDTAGPLSAAISLAEELAGPQTRNGHHPAGDGPREPVLFLRRNTLPEAPPAAAGSDWDAVPGDEAGAVAGWVEDDEDGSAPAAAEGFLSGHAGAEQEAVMPQAPAARHEHSLLFGFEDTPAGDHDWRRFEVHPREQAGGEAAGELLQDPGTDSPFEMDPGAAFEQDAEPGIEPDTEAAFGQSADGGFAPGPAPERVMPFHARGDVVEPWDDHDAYPVDEAAEPDAAFDVDELLAYPPPVLTFRTRVDVREARKLCAQLTREWRASGAEPALEDVAIRAIARALGESRALVAASGAVGLVTVSREGERLTVVEDAASRPFREAVLALAEEIGSAPAAACAVTLLPLGTFGLDEGTPPLPAGHAIAFAVGAVCEEPAPAVNITLSYDPEAIGVGEAAWFLGRVRELVEAPYALLAD